MDIKRKTITELEKAIIVLNQDNKNENNEEIYCERDAIKELLFSIIEEIRTSDNQNDIIKIMTKLKKDLYEYFTEWWINNEIASKVLNDLQLYMLKYKRNNILSSR